MLSSLLTKNKKFTQDDLIQELINPNSSSEKLNQIYNFLKIDLNSLQIDEEPILHVCCKKDIFESDDFGTFQLMYDSGTIFPYLINTKVPFRLAHAFFTTAIVSVPTTSLGTILANTQFEIPIGVKLKN